jgi:hypothetical protein
MSEVINNQHPLAEVFGYPITNFTENAKRNRRNRLCPFHNRVPNCTKDKANDPLGVCSIYNENSAVITCPIRFREDWIITEGAANFFFGKNATWTSISEVNLTDRSGKSAGHIDIVLVEYDKQGKVADFGTLEVQAVYISGNIRRPFEYYMENPSERRNMVWKGNPNYPKPDYLSSSRKRLIPQILYKGGILKAWGKKQAVALQESFFRTLPEMPTSPADKADIAWLIYDLEKDTSNDCWHLVQKEIVYTQFGPAMDRIIKPEPGEIGDFLDLLQSKLDEQKGDNPPDAPILTDEILQ